jgi:DNA invertase Pin-like site-specific DNA recombinase
VANNPSANRLLLHVFSAVAEDEARAIGERTKAALKAAKARGVKLGASNPASRNLSQNAMEKARLLGPAANRDKAIKEFADLLPLLKQWRADGKSLREIAALLDDDDVPTRQGGSWSAAQVKRVLDRAG